MRVKIVRAAGYTVTEEALQQAAFLGIGGNRAARLKRMAKRSAPFTSPLGNKRYEDYALSVSKDKVISGIARI